LYAIRKSTDLRCSLRHVGARIKRDLHQGKSLLSKRWVTEVFFAIEEGHNRFSSIREELELISDHILADRLRLLETNHFISKKIYNEIPLRVEYSLTEKGTQLSSLLGNLCDFAETTSLAETAT
jgi:DNA-binding HxlR family transcriptional regulator